MNYRRITGLFGGAVGAAAVGTELAQAQESSGGSITIGSDLDGLGESIFSSVTNAVYGGSSDDGSSDDGSDDSTASGGTSVEHSELSFGEQEGLAIADASGGNNNVSFVS
jgi:hypothetical protein